MTFLELFNDNFLNIFSREERKGEERNVRGKLRGKERKKKGRVEEKVRKRKGRRKE